MGLGYLAFALAAVIGLLALEAFLLLFALAFTASAALARASLRHFVVLGLHASLILRCDSHLDGGAIDRRQTLDTLSVTGQLIHQLAIVVHANALGAVDRAPSQVELLASALHDARVNAALSLDPSLAAVGSARLTTTLADSANRHTNCLLAKISNAHRGVASRNRHDLVVVVRTAFATLARFARLTGLRRLALDGLALALLFLLAAITAIATLGQQVLGMNRVMRIGGGAGIRLVILDMLEILDVNAVMINFACRGIPLDVHAETSFTAAADVARRMRTVLVTLIASFLVSETSQRRK